MQETRTAHLFVVVNENAESPAPRHGPFRGLVQQRNQRIVDAAAGRGQAPPPVSELPVELLEGMYPRLARKGGPLGLVHATMTRPRKQRRHPRPPHFHLLTDAFRPDRIVAAGLQMPAANPGGGQGKLGR